MLPSNKKAGYILRKMIRCILELLYTQPFSPIVESIIETTNCYLNLTDDCQDFDRKIISEVIIEECQIYIKNIDRGKQLARNFLAGKENIPVEKLYVEIQSTFGLPRIVIDDLLKGFESDNKFI
jgi:alanyl-tRNA synthetase